MSTPLLWIVLPLIVAALSFFLRRWKRIVTLALAGLTLLLAFIAWRLPISELVIVGPWVIEFDDRLVFAGRLFELAEPDRPMLIVIYLTITFFLVGSLSAGVSKWFAPVGLAMSAMLIASLAVEPFLYAALLIQVAVLLSIPLLSPPGQQIERGVVRYLTFMSFGLPFLLMGGWLLSNLEPGITDPTEAIPVLMFLGLGFAFLLAIFPLNAWLPMLTGRVHPYAVTFVLSVLPLIVISLLSRFTNGYNWILDFDVIPFLGVLMVVTGGFWAAFQRNFGRILGYAIIIEIGHSLLALSLPDGYSIYAAMFIPRGIALAVWSLALSIIRVRVDDLSFRSVQGLGRKSPLLALSVSAANFSLAGFPLLASFPVLLALWSQLALTSAAMALLALLGSSGLVIAGLRSLAVFVMGPDELAMEDYDLSRLAKFFLVLGMSSILIIGLFPHWLFGIFSNITGLSL
jgi:formate hydrogenlyase subunit 3/multisubunit Na+/H+ antiporter MnhD subunit